MIKCNSRASGFHPSITRSISPCSIMHAVPIFRADRGLRLRLHAVDIGFEPEAEGFDRNLVGEEGG